MDFLRKRSVAYTIAIVIVVLSTRHLYQSYSDAGAVEVNENTGNLIQQFIEEREDRIVGALREDENFSSVNLEVGSGNEIIYVFIFTSTSTFPADIDDFETGFLNAEGIEDVANNLRDQIGLEYLTVRSRFFDSEGELLLELSFHSD